MESNIKVEVRKILHTLLCQPSDIFACVSTLVYFSSCRRGGIFKRDSLKHLKREIKEGVKDIKDEVTHIKQNQVNTRKGKESFQTHVTWTPEFCLCAWLVAKSKPMQYFFLWGHRSLNHNILHTLSSIRFAWISQTWPDAKGWMRYYFIIWYYWYFF